MTKILPKISAHKHFEFLPVFIFIKEQEFPFGCFLRISTMFLYIPKVYVVYTIHIPHDDVPKNKRKADTYFKRNCNLYGTLQVAPTLHQKNYAHVYIAPIVFLFFQDLHFLPNFCSIWRYFFKNLQCMQLDKKISGR